MLEQDAPPARRGLDQRAQRVEPRALARNARLADFAQSLAGAGEIVGAPEQMCLRRIAVAACAAGFLLIALDRFRERGMGDEPDVGLVDAHPERDRRNHHHVFGCDERRLVALADG